MRRPGSAAATRTTGAVMLGDRRIELRETELRPPARDEVLLRVEACGVCGSDLEAWSRPHGRGGPGASGHELVGVVDAVGADVASVATGERVCVDPNLAVACGDCAPCRTGSPYHCRSGRRLPGWGFARHMLLRAAGAVPIPRDARDPAAYTLTEPLACAVHALRACGGPLDGRCVAVVGAGALGLLTIVVARHSGASVVAVARHPPQRTLAAALGADAVLDARDPGLADALAEHGPELVVVAAGGSSQLLDLAVRVVAPGGDVVVAGLLERPQALDARRAVLREVRVTFAVSHGASGGRSDFALALELLEADAAVVLPLLTHRLPLARVAEAFARAADKSSGAVRVLVQPWA